MLQVKELNFRKVMGLFWPPEKQVLQLPWVFAPQFCIPAKPDLSKLMLHEEKTRLARRI